MTKSHRLKELTAFLEGKDMSHVTSKANWKAAGKSVRSSNAAANIEIETHAFNAARGSANMSAVDKYSLRVLNSVSAIKSAAKCGAVVGGTISGIQHGIAFYNGQEDATTAAKAVVKDAGIGALTGAGFAALSAACPPLGAAVSVGLGVYTLGPLLFSAGSHLLSKRSASVPDQTPSGVDTEAQTDIHPETGSLAPVAGITEGDAVAADVEDGKQLTFAELAELEAAALESLDPASAAALLDAALRASATPTSDEGEGEEEGWDMISESSASQALAPPRSAGSHVLIADV